MFCCCRMLMRMTGEIVPGAEFTTCGEYYPELFESKDPQRIVVISFDNNIVRYKLYSDSVNFEVVESSLIDFMEIAVPFDNN